MIPIILLAAGSSSRMRGRDKVLEPIDGTPLLRRQAQAARAVSDQVLVALPSAPHPRYAAIADLDVQTLAVPDAAEGMGASIRTAFAALPARADKAMLLLADLPEITQQDLARMMTAAQNNPDALVWRGTTEDGKAGHPIIFDRALFPDLTQLQGDTGGQDVIRQARHRVHLVRLPAQRARLDLDTPEDWDQWRANRR